MLPIIGSEAIADGTLTRGQLRWNYRALHPDVYVRKDVPRSLFVDAHAAWLATGRKGIVSGRAAAALLGVDLVPDGTPIEIIGEHGRRRRGIVMRDERIEADEIKTYSDGFRITTPARTALDLARFLPRDQAVQHLDALARGSRLTCEDVSGLVARNKGARGLTQARIALALMDGGAAAPQETTIRLWLRDAGIPAPRTDIILGDWPDTTRVALGWRRQRLAVNFYDATEWSFMVHLIHHQDLLRELGWTEIKVGSHHSKASVVGRVRRAIYGAI